MFAVPRRAGVLLAGLVAAGIGLASMRPNNVSDHAQKWFKTTTDSGFAVYTNAKTGTA